MELVTLLIPIKRRKQLLKNTEALKITMLKWERREKKDVLYLFSWIWNTHDALLTQAAGEWDTREANRYLYPFRDGMDEVRMTEYERIFGERFPTWDAVLWKALWLPTAVVADVILMPVYIVYFGCLGIAITMVLIVGSPIQ